MTDHLFEASGRTCALYCISAGRPGNVATTEATWAGLPITWVVPAHEEREYRATGARRVIAVATVPDTVPLSTQRNAALNDAFAHGATCVQTDDDARRLMRWADGKAAPATPAHYLAQFDAALREVPAARLTGCAPSPNAFYSIGKVKTRHWVMGQLFAVAPSSPRFDPTLPIREDYDYTCQHLTTYGAVARHDGLLPRYTHWTNRGGCQAYRSPDLDMRVNARLVDRWPHLLHSHPTRAGELVLKAARDWQPSPLTAPRGAA